MEKDDLRRYVLESVGCVGVDFQLNRAAQALELSCAPLRCYGGAGITAGQAEQP